jgi:t-SNARE complex subunit (syntaxin)
MWLFAKNQNNIPLQPLIIDHDQYQTQQLIHANKFDNDTKFQNVIIDERNTEIEAIAKEMHQNHQMMCAIAELVDTQGHIVDDIRHNITVTEKNVEGGNKDLLGAEEKQKTGNTLTMIFAAIMAIGVTITTTIVALKV